MDVKQIRLAKMATFCYLIGDRKSNTCALIDPAFETDRILEKAKESEYRITHLINTHAHSDHTAGNGAINLATGGCQCIIGS
jgi:glyoxylase-like metal-dependent hydrolase (beta-lactamase superfamily II)